MSVGTQDAVGLSSEEAPTTPTVDDEDLARGTATPSECEFNESQSIQDADDAQRAAGSDAFCGHLWYNEDTQYAQPSPPDQDYPLSAGDGSDGSPIGTWDVVYGAYVGNYGLSTCIPWCYPPGGQTVYDQLHDTGSQLGISDDSKTIREEERYGWQTYAVNVLYPGAAQVVQQQTDLWEMNGFTFTQPDQQFVGFLEDSQGNPVSASELESIHENETATTDGGLSEDTGAFVCGFTPDYEIAIDAPQASYCEVLFAWVSSQNPTQGGVLKSDDYNEPCESPAYVCGGITEAWYAQLVCTAATPVGSNPASGCGKSTNSYEAWHWVVAPAPSDCSNDVEPGFQIKAGTDGAAYLAHDLDVYTPLASADGRQQGTADVQNGLENGLSGLTGIPVNSDDPYDMVVGDSVDVAGSTAAEQTPRQISKVDRIEPNHAADDSQTFEETRSSTGGSCDAVREGNEQVYDPWRNVIDNEVTFDQTGEPLAAGDSSFSEGGQDLYLNQDPDQDASNRPGAGLYFTEGYVGMFADKDDDGAYDRLDANNKLQGINAEGAYPLVWDIHTNKTKLANTGSPSKAMEGGCQPGFSDVLLTDAAKQAGYGPETGLVQVIYLNEPSHFVHTGTLDAFPAPSGDTAFVALSDALIDYRSTDVNADFVQQQVDKALSQLPSQPSNVLYLNDFTAEGVQDFGAQCAEDTGGFTSQWSFTHTCGGDNGGTLCAGDTVVTQYLLDNEDPNGVLGGSGSAIPELVVDGSAVEFPTQTVWTDVDPLDGNADRNDDTCQRPNHHTQDDAEQDHRGDKVNDARYPCGHSHYGN